MYVKLNGLSVTSPLSTILDYECPPWEAACIYTTLRYTTKAMINPYQGGKVICMRAVIASMLLSYDMSASFSRCNKAMGWGQHVPAL